MLIHLAQFVSTCGAAATIAIRGPHRAELSQLISAKVFALYQGTTLVVP
jgi:hypothetical protein